MKKSLLAGALLLLPAPVAAQVAPPGYDTKEGEAYMTIFGSFAEGHFQHMEGELRGSRAVIQRIGYRLDYRRYIPFYGMGRSWTNVKLYLSHCDVNRRSRTWTQNSLDTQVKLFDAKYSWPTRSGYPSSWPAPFDLALSFPLTGKFVYKGVNDLLVEYQFRGGLMANKATWGKVGTSTYVVPYFLDAPRFANLPFYTQAVISLYGSSNCTDSSHANPGLMVPDLKTYAKVTGNTTASNKFFFQLSSYFTAPKKLALHALGSVGSSTGTNIGACNPLHVTPLFVSPALASGITSAAHTKFGHFPYEATAVGFTLWAQAAWGDSKTGALSLTKAASVVVPAQPPSPSQRYMLYYHDMTATTGTGPTNSQYYNPIVKYSIR